MPLVAILIGLALTFASPGEGVPQSAPTFKSKCAAAIDPDENCPADSRPPTLAQERQFRDRLQALISQGRCSDAAKLASRADRSFLANRILSYCNSPPR